MNDVKADETRAIVRDHYGKVAATKATSGCAPGCCGPVGGDYAATLGYSADDQAAAPEGADLGLGCGNPTAIASLREGVLPALCASNPSERARPSAICDRAEFATHRNNKRPDMRIS